MAETLHMDRPAHRDDGQLHARQRRGARRTALLLVLVAAAFYFGFIAYAVTQGLHGHH
jgi:hypothetical protein